MHAFRVRTLILWIIDDKVPHEDRRIALGRFGGWAFASNLCASSEPARKRCAADEILQDMREHARIQRAERHVDKREEQAEDRRACDAAPALVRVREAKGKRR